MMKEFELWILSYDDTGSVADFEECVTVFPYTAKTKKDALQKAKDFFKDALDLVQVLQEEAPKNLNYSLVIEDCKVTKEGKQTLVQCVDVIDSKEIYFNPRRITREIWNKRWTNGRNYLPSKGSYNDFCDAVHITNEYSVSEVFNKYFKFGNAPFSFSAPKFRLCLNMILDLLNVFGFSFEKIDAFKKKVMDELDNGWEMYFDFNIESFH